MDDDRTLESIAASVEAGHRSIDELLQVFLSSTVAMPSANDPVEGGVSPVFTEVDDVPHVVVASSGAALQKTAAHAPFAVTLTGRQVVDGLNAQFALLINTPSTAFSFSPELLAEARSAGKEN